MSDIQRLSDLRRRKLQPLMGRKISLLKATRSDRGDRTELTGKEYETATVTVLHLFQSSDGEDG